MTEREGISTSSPLTGQWIPLPFFTFFTSNSKQYVPDGFGSKCRKYSPFTCVQVHAYIIGYLRGQMPAMMGKEKVQKKLINGEIRLWKSEKEFSCRRKGFANYKPVTFVVI